MRYLITMLMLLIGFLLPIRSAVSQIPRFINYQGIVSQNGQPIDGNKQLTLRLYYDDSGGIATFESTISAAFSKGLFNTMIGALPNTIDFSKPLYLGVSVEGAAEIQPR